MNSIPHEFQALLGFPALVEHIDRNTHYKLIEPANQIIVCNLIFDKLGSLFDGTKSFFTTPDELYAQAERWIPTLSKMYIKTILNGLKYVLDGNTDLEHAPNPAQFLKICKTMSFVPYHDGGEQLRKLIPLPDHVRERYNLPKLGASEQDRLESPSQESPREKSLKISEAAISQCMKALGKPPKYPDCKATLPPEPRVRTKDWFEKTQSAMFNKTVNADNFVEHMKQVFAIRPGETTRAPAYEYTINEYNAAPRELPEA